MRYRAVWAAGAVKGFGKTLIIALQLRRRPARAPQP